jgi:hypothetical protein
MKKTIKLISFVLAILCVSCCFASCEIAPDAYYIFEDISECEKFAESGKITPREVEGEDEIKGLEYTAYYGARYDSEEFSFDIVALEFVDDANAKEFYRRVDGVRISGTAAANSIHDFPYYYLRAVDGNRAYAIVCTSSKSKVMNEFLSQMFSKKLTA